MIKFFYELPFMMQLKCLQQHHKSALVKVCGIFLFAIYLSSASSLVCANTSQAKAAYYRYYDSKGVATVSRNVSPTHIQRGYEVLDRNMYLIKKVPAYSVEKDLKQEQNRAVQSEQARKDQTLKKSYRNVAFATEKKKEILNILQKQIDKQYQEMQRLQTDRSKYLQQKNNYVLDRKPIPALLQQNLNNNEAHIKNTRNSIEQLKLAYSKQEQHFDYIISRLQKME